MSFFRENIMKLTGANANKPTQAIKRYGFNVLTIDEDLFKYIVF